MPAPHRSHLPKGQSNADTVLEVNESATEPPALKVGFHVLNRQRLVAAEENYFRDIGHLPVYGPNVLLYIVSEDSSYTWMLKQKVMAEINGAELVTKHGFATGGEKLYNDMGPERLVGHLEASFRLLSGDSGLLNNSKFGTVIIGAVGTYIRLSMSDRSGAEFGIVMLYNASTKRRVVGTTRGVPMQTDYLDEARAEGSTTSYGQILRRYYDCTAKSYMGNKGFDIARDWHKLVCGFSMFELLEDVTATLGPIVSVT